MAAIEALPVVGILLAAGIGRRFDSTGRSDKLLQPLASGEAVAAMSAKRLRAACDIVIAVVRAADGELAQVLAGAGCQVVECAEAAEGMGSSIACGMRGTPAAAAYVIALADMPKVRTHTIATLVASVRSGADIAAPVVNGRRGNPVAFSMLHRDYLLQLNGAEGARQRLREWPVNEITVDDPGVLQDVDTAADLDQLR